MVRCPGQDQRFWKPGDIFEVKCPDCGRAVEFFKDEPKLKCRKCGQQVTNPKIDLGCAKWCQYAEQCVGTPAAEQINIMRNRLVEEMKKIFGTDQKRIDHALSVLDYAEQIHESEGGDPLVVKAGAILHDIGIGESERKHGSSAGRYQEIEGPPIARGILTMCGISDDDIEHICKIVGSHHSGKDIDTIEFAIVWDADWLVNIPMELADCSDEVLRGTIEKVFKTRTGLQIATELFLKNHSKPVGK
jgi:putative nucleotidyltransferase with HDIG domain